MGENFWELNGLSNTHTPLDLLPAKIHVRKTIGVEMSPYSTQPQTAPISLPALLTRVALLVASPSIRVVVSTHTG